MKIHITVEKGRNSGQSYELPVRSYRAVGRSGSGEVTVHMSAEGDRALDPDDLERVEAHLQKRGGMSAEPETKPRIGAFRREHDILLDDEKVSRTHAMIFLDDDGPSIVDLESTNGTLVNGKKVRDADLENGDLINIGKTRFSIKVG